MKFQCIDFGSPLYAAELALRDRVLRQPLGLSLFDEDLSAESACQHFGICEQQKLLACVVCVPLGSKRAKLKQMAVDQDYRGQGLGRLLISEVEGVLVKAGVAELELAARVSAVGFYRAADYHEQGEVFQQVGLDHIRMVKMLS